MARQAQGQVTRAISLFWAALIASPTLRKVMAVVGAVILVPSLILSLAGVEAGVAGVLVGVVLLGTAVSRGWERRSRGLWSRISGSSSNDDTEEDTVVQAEGSGATGRSYSGGRLPVRHRRQK
jgi:hypothetical protein